MSDSKKQLIRIEELVRSVQSLIHPIGYEDTLKDLMMKPAGELFKGDYSKCVIPWKVGSHQIDLPICNRYGSVDPKMIKFSRNIVKRLRSMENYDIESANIIIGKLDRIARRFVGKVPKPHNTSAKNGAMTRHMNKLINNLKGHLS